LTAVHSLLVSLSLLALLALAPVATAQSFAVVGVLRLEPSDNYVSSSAIDTSSGYAYFAVHGKIMEIRLSDFLRISTLTLDHVEDVAWSAVIDTVSGFAYFGTYPGGGLPDKSGIIVKIRLSDFARVGTLVLNQGEDNSIGVIDTVHGFAYFISRSNVIVKVRLSDFTRVGELTLPGEGWPSSAVVDDRNEFAYIGKSVSRKFTGGGGIVVKISLADFTVVGTLNLNQDENELYSSVVDVTNGFAYFGGGLSDDYGNAITVKIVKIRLSDLTRVSALTLNPGESRVRSGIIDTANGFAYFATSGSIVRIRLSDFTRVDAINLPDIPGWGTIYPVETGVIDPSSGFAYFGTWTTPGYILKVSLAKSTERLMTGTTLIVVSSAIAFPVLTVSIVAAARMRRPRTYHPKQRTSSWGPIATITGGGMLLVASLWQLEIIEEAALHGQEWCPPFVLGGCQPWYIARDIWFAGVFAAFVIALTGAWRYTGFTRSLSARPVESYRATSVQRGPALSDADERLYSYITKHGGTISLSTASNDLGMSMAEVNASISRLKQAGRIR